MNTMLAMQRPDLLQAFLQGAALVTMRQQTAAQASRDAKAALVNRARQVLASAMFVRVEGPTELVRSLPTPACDCREVLQLLQDFTDSVMMELSPGQPLRNRGTLFVG